MADLRAVTTPLTDDVDLNDVAGDDGYLFVRDGVGVAGRGVAARVGGDALATLAAIDHDDRAGLAGCGPVAMGSVPYRPGSEPQLVIPSVIVGRDADGHRWRTDVFTAGDDPRAVDVPRTATPEPSAGSFTVAPITPVETYLAAVAAARDAVRDLSPIHI